MAWLGKHVGVGFSVNVANVEARIRTTTSCSIRERNTIRATAQQSEPIASTVFGDIQRDSQVARITRAAWPLIRSMIGTTETDSRVFCPLSAARRKSFGHAEASQRASRSATRPSAPIQRVESSMPIFWLRQHALVSQLAADSTQQAP